MIKIVIGLLFNILNLHSQNIIFNEEKYLMHADKQISNISFENTMLSYYFIETKKMPFSKDSIGTISYIVDGYNPSECYYPIYKVDSEYIIKDVYCKKLNVNIEKQNRDFILTKSSCNKNLKLLEDSNLLEVCKDDEEINISLNDIVKTTVKIGNISCLIKKDDSDMMFVNFNFNKCSWNIPNIDYVIKFEKQYLYKELNKNSKTKMYLVKNDVVEIMEEKEDWIYILYISKDNKEIKAWIPKNALEFKGSQVE